MRINSQQVVVIGKIVDTNVQMLGTGFVISKDGKLVTARHVIGNEDKDLVILLPHIKNINEYQDLSDFSCTPIKVTIEEINPITDLCILKGDFNFQGALPEISSLDNINVGDRIGILGFPHCIMGRRVLTYQETIIGAKMLLESSSIKSKYATINIQTRPGQSGSLIFNLQTGNVLGLLIGTYAPNSGVIIAGINPHELNQTSYCISGEHIKEML